MRPCLVSLFLALLTLNNTLFAQTNAPYPIRPIRFVVGFAAGGPTDVIARITGQDLTAELGQTVVIDNRTGANAQIATELVAHANNDGHTLLYSSLSLLVNAILLENKVRYDPFKDFVPITNAAVLPMVLVTSPNTHLNSIKELLTTADRKSTRLNSSH